LYATFSVKGLFIIANARFPDDIYSKITQGQYFIITDILNLTMFALLMIEFKYFTKIPQTSSSLRGPARLLSMSLVPIFGALLSMTLLMVLVSLALGLYS
jgi:hypothetical protein